jgi:hypothetical protein
MLLEIKGLREILCLSQLSAGGRQWSVQVFLFEQTAASLPDLFRPLPDLEYIADQPGPHGRAFRLGGRPVPISGLTPVPRKREKPPRKSTPDCRSTHLCAVRP